MKSFKQLNSCQKIVVIILTIIAGLLGAYLTRPVKQQPKPKPEQVGMVHDYVIQRAQDYCKEYGTSLHYILPKVKRLESKLGEMQYCDDIFYVRCQDDSLIIMTSTMFCGGVSQIQADESLQEKGSRVIKIQTQG